MGRWAGRKLEEAAETAERTDGICVAWELVDLLACKGSDERGAGQGRAEQCRCAGEEYT